MAVMPQTRRPLAQQPEGGGRFDPMRDIEQMLGQLMQTTLGASDGVFTPLVDIEETEDAWLFEAEVPGVDKKDINIEVRDSEVLVSGEIKERERKGILRRRTRPVGRFEARVVLPGEVDADNIDASLDNGVLTLRIPKAEKARPRRIPIADGSARSNGGGGGT